MSNKIYKSIIFSTPVMILTDNNYEANVDQLLQEIMSADMILWISQI